MKFTSQPFVKDNCKQSYIYILVRLITFNFYYSQIASDKTN